MAMKNSRFNLVQTHVISGKKRRSYATLEEAFGSFYLRFIARRAVLVADLEIVSALKSVFFVD